MKELMSGLFKQFKLNADKENNGVEIAFEDAENEDGTVPTFIIARAGDSNKAFGKAMEAATRPYRRQIDSGEMKADVVNSLYIKVFCAHSLKGWSNVRDEENNEIKYSAEKALELMNALPEVYNRLTKEATAISNFRQAALDTEAKN